MEWAVLGRGGVPGDPGGFRGVDVALGTGVRGGPGIAGEWDRLAALGGLFPPE